MRFLSLIPLLLIVSCVHRPVPDANGVFLASEKWAASITKRADKEFVVIVVLDSRYEQEAVKTFCTDSYICIGPDDIGRTIVLERIVK